MFFSEIASSEKISVNEQAVDILVKCLEFHEKEWPERDVNVLEKAYAEHIEGADASGYRILSEIQHAVKNGMHKGMDIRAALMYITQSYAIEAIQKNSRGQSDLAEQLLRNACYWCGNLWNSLGADEAIKATAQKARNDVARAGSRVKKEKNIPLRNELYTFVRNNSPWKSVFQAAEAASIESGNLNGMLPLLAKKAEEKAKGDVDKERQYPVITLYRWIQEMPGLDGVISKKKNN